MKLIESKVDELLKETKFQNSTINIEFLSRRKGLGSTFEVISLKESVAKDIKLQVKKMKKDILKSQKNKVKDSEESEEISKSDMFKRRRA